MPNIYIIIVTWNSSKHISKCLLSLHEMDYDKENWNLIVVDNNSKDDTLSILKEWQAKMRNFPNIIENRKNLGFSGGNNQGIKLALEKGADYIALLNDDTLVDKKWLSRIIEKMKEDKELGLCQPLLTRYPEVHLVNNFGNAYQYCGFGYSIGEGKRDERITETFYEPAYCSFAAVVIRRQVFEQIGFLDELYFMYHEDTDFSFRARLQGWKLGALKNAIVHHNYKFPSKKNKIRYFWLEKNRIYLIKKFFTRKTRRTIRPALFAMGFGLIIFSIIRGFFWYRLKAYWWVFRHKQLIKQNHHKIQQTRKFSDKKLFQYMVPTIEFQEIENPLLNKIGNPLLKWYFEKIKNKIT